MNFFDDFITIVALIILICVTYKSLVKHNSSSCFSHIQKFESNLYPRLWSCLYIEKDIKFNFSYHSQSGEDMIFYKRYFRNKLNGIYIELGALDGIKYSNTFFFENYLGWSGILIEGGLNNCKNLISNQNKRPRSQIICSTVCKNDYAEFIEKSAVGGISGELPQNWFNLDKNKSVIVKCSNISNILHIHKVTHIDFFSLDVEGAELNILETFDFSIFVHFWVIEFNSGNIIKNNIVRKKLLENGYIQCSIKLTNNNECWEDRKYERKIKHIIEDEKKYRSNFGMKCKY